MMKSIGITSKLSKQTTVGFAVALFIISITTTFSVSFIRAQTETETILSENSTQSAIGVTQINASSPSANLKKSSSATPSATQNSQTPTLRTTTVEEPLVFFDENNQARVQVKLPSNQTAKDFAVQLHDHGLASQVRLATTQGSIIGDDEDGVVVPTRANLACSDFSDVVSILNSHPHDNTECFGKLQISFPSNVSDFELIFACNSHESCKSSLAHLHIGVVEYLAQ